MNRIGDLDRTISHGLEAADASGLVPRTGGPGRSGLDIRLAATGQTQSFENSILQTVVNTGDILFEAQARPALIAPRHFHRAVPAARFHPSLWPKRSPAVGESQNFQLFFTLTTKALTPLPPVSTPESLDHHATS